MIEAMVRIEASPISSGRGLDTDRDIYHDNALMLIRQADLEVPGTCGYGARASRLGAARVHLSSGGFSLVELLVGMGVIAVLIGLSLPVLRRVREAGQAASCLSNSRQLGSLVTLYAGTYADSFPAWVGDGADTTGDRRRWGLYVNQAFQLFGRDPWADFTGLDPLIAEVLYCPANQAYPDWYLQNGHADPDYWMSSSIYLAAKYLDPGLPEGQWRHSLGARVQRLGALAFPSKKVVLFEGEIWHGWDGSWCIGCEAGSRQYDGCDRSGSVWFGDGHADARKSASAAAGVTRYPVWPIGPYQTIAWGVLGRDVE